MKKFQVLTRGMLKDSREYTNVRNQIYAELRNAKVEAQEQRMKTGGAKVMEQQKTDFSSFFNLLIVSPTDPDSMEVLVILNYFSFPMSVEEDNLSGFVRKEFGFKNDKCPCLMIDSSTAEMPSATLTSKDNILTFLYNKSLIGTYKQHSVYEK